VKFVFPAITVLILAAAVIVRDEAGVLCSSPRTSEKSKVAPVLLPKDNARDLIPAASERIQEKAPPVAAMEKASIRKIPSPSTQEMGFVLKDELTLTDQQMERVSAALEARATDLQDCHDTIRKSKVFDPREYGKTLGRMKEVWFRNIDAVLDSRQHERFLELVVDGILRSGTEFQVDLDVMTVIR